LTLQRAVPPESIRSWPVSAASRFAKTNQKKVGQAESSARFAETAWTISTLGGSQLVQITLVIDAMDLLHSGRFDGFCLVSSDSAFTRLASRIGEQGVDVFGFGEQKTPKSSRQACRRFIYSEILVPTAPTNGSEVADTPKSLQPPSAATPIIKKVLAQMESEDGSVTLGGVGAQLANLASDFDPRTFGFRKLSDLVRKTGASELEQRDGKPLRIRMKSAMGQKVI
jgi:uncharacterized LabA/DUF88 family protein